MTTSWALCAANVNTSTPSRTISASAPQPTISPVSAMPAPRSPVLRTARRAAWPSMIAGIAVSPEVRKTAMPQASAATASELTPGCAGGYSATGYRAWPPSGPAGRSATSDPSSP